MERNWLVIKLSNRDGLRRSPAPERAYVVPMRSPTSADGRDSHIDALDAITEPGTYLVQPCPEGPANCIAYDCRRFTVGLEAREVPASDEVPA